MIRRKGACTRSAWAALARVSALLLIAGAGCARDAVILQAGIPGVSVEATVEFLGQHSSYLDAIVKAGGAELRFFFPSTEECVKILRADASVRFAWLGPLGRLRAGDIHCDPIGLLSLEAWRDRRPRPLRAAVVPRKQAVFEVIYRDDQIVLARGRFPLARLIGWTGAVDTIGVLPAGDACRDVLARGVASMEFRAAGTPSFSLVGAHGLCPLIGFTHAPEIL